MKANGISHAAGSLTDLKDISDVKLLYPSLSLSLSKNIFYFLGFEKYNLDLAGWFFVNWAVYLSTADGVRGVWWQWWRMFAEKDDCWGSLGLHLYPAP